MVIHVDHKVDKGETCCRSCCNGVYSFFGTLFCFKKNQSLMSKLGITWLWSLFIPLALGLLLGLYVFAPFNFVSSPGDQRDVMGHYDTFFCDAIRLDSSSRFDAYLLGKSPSILQSNRSYNTFELNNITMKPGSFKTWNFYLLEGTIVQFEICNARRMEFFMMRGTSNYNKWKKDSTDCECFMEHISLTRYLPECANQSSGRDVTTFNFTTSISETDEYYLVFENPSNKDPNEMNLNLQINRSTYDVKDGLKKSCINLSACDFSLGFLSTASVVYVSEEKTQFGIGNHVYCNPTWAVYFVFFGGIPMIVGFSISLVLFVLFMHCPRAWEGVHRPKPWDDLPKKDQKPSILDTVPEDTSKGKKEKQSKTESNAKSNGKILGKKSGYDTLIEEETDEESMTTLPGTSPPHYSAVKPVQDTDGEPTATTATNEPEVINGTTEVEVHVTPE